MNSLKTLIRKTIIENFEPHTIFKTKINNRVYLYDLQMSPIGIQFGLENKDEHEEECELYVEWELNIDANSEGVDNFSINFVNVTGIILVKPDPYKSDEEVKIPFDAKGLHFKLINDMKIGHTIRPTDLEINFRRNEIQIK